MKKILALSLVLLTALTLVVPMSAKDNETVEALYFDTPPVFDGVITEEEWGKPTVEVKAGQATTYQMGADVVELTMKLWIRWDEEYMYVGVTSPDTDGQSLQEAGANNWNGDSIQFRFDPMGPNSSGNSNAPFSENNTTIPNVSFGFLTNEGKESAVDHRSLITDLNDSAMFKFGEADGVFTWEVAIKHSDICVEYGDILNDVKAGFTYGFTIVRLNAPKGETYNAWLTWGDGVCGPQDDEFRCGSNAVTLSKTPAVVKPVVEETAAMETTAETTMDAEPVSTAPKTLDPAVCAAAAAVLAAAGYAFSKKH